MRTFLFCAACTVALSISGVASARDQSQQQPSSSPVPAQQPPAQQAPAQQPKPARPAKKVWTNDDIEALRDHGGVSVVGGSQGEGGTGTNGSGTQGNQQNLPNEKNPSWYKKQLDPLYAKLDAINAQIANAEAALSGDTRGSDSVSLNAYGMTATPGDQLKELQAQKQDVQDKIDALLDAARHNGVEPGELR